ncbi:MAG: sterol desaturase family protein [Candidatus Kapabacteria bacterium]|jgi:sterol desaturase/sphingolipid hydroxylase (fatty acid hydroxylase superfamily)|nr:sterol desaturase family protein [Candidatus Kapabacteria bacterium]
MLHNIDSYWLTWSIILTFLTVRYGVIAGVFFVWWYIVKRERYAPQKIQMKYPAKQDYKREIGYSAATFFIFTTVASTVYMPQIRPLTQLHRDVSEIVGINPAWQAAYWIGGVLLMLVIHDAYFYFMHRAVHHKKLYPIVHKVHHLSYNPTPWAAFAFHPFEALTEFLIFPIVAFTIPHTIGMIATWLGFMTLYNAYGHLGFELYPKGFSSHAVGKWINTSVNHNMHHKYATSNYGLYTLVWDRLFGTVHAKYDETFEEVKRRTFDGRQ